MKKSQLSLLMVFFLSMITSCQPAQPTVEPTLKEFQPGNDSLFKITFSYPDDWIWVEDIPFDEPQGEPPPSERIVLYEGSVSIQVYMPSNPRSLMQEWMDAYSGAVASRIRTDITIPIDGYNARWLTVFSPPQNTSGAHISEAIYFLTDDRFYILDLYILESETDGSIHNQFKELIKSIKVLP